MATAKNESENRLVEIQRTLTATQKSLDDAKAAAIADKAALIASKSDLERRLAATEKSLEELRRTESKERAALTAAKSDLERRLATNEVFIAGFRNSAEMESASLAATKSELEKRLAESEEARAKLAQEVQVAAGFKTEAAVVRTERDHALASLEDAQRTLRDAAAANAKEAERLQSATDGTRAELAVARRMHSEVVATLASVHEQTGAERAELAAKLTAAEQARQQFSESVGASDRTVKDLERKLEAAAHAAAESEERQKSDFARVQSALESERRENEEHKQRLAALQDDFQHRIRVIEEQLVAASTEKQSVAAQLHSEQEARSKAVAAAAEERQALSQQRDVAVSQLEAERTRRTEELAAVTRELEKTISDREQLARQRDELSRRIGRITDEHKRLLDDMSDTPEIDARQRSVRAPEVKPQIVDATDSISFPPEAERTVNLPPARPASVPPPKVRTL